MTMEVRGSTPKNSASAPGLEGLQNGSRGPDVIALQKKLNERGAQLECDGKFGPLTEAALQKFQADSGCGGNGRVDAGTVTALQTPATPAATTTPAATPAATTPTKEAPAPQVTEGARRKLLGGEELVRARLDGVNAAQAKGEKFEVLSEDNLKQVSAQLETVEGALGQQKTAVATKRQELEGQVKLLEQNPKRTVPEEALLMGKKGQVDVLAKAEQHLEAQKAVVGAAADAISDGVATETEANAINNAQGALNQGAQALAALDNQASTLVARAEEAGARVPGQTTTDPTTTTTPAAPSPSLDDVKKETAGLRTRMNQQRAELSILKSAPPKDPLAKPAFDADVGLKEHELSLTQRRIADLGKAETGLAKGPLSAEDSAALSTSKQQFDAQTTLLASGRKAFAGVAALKDAMVKESGSPEAYVAAKEKSVVDANAALKRAQTRGDPDAIRSASANASKAAADRDVAQNGKALIETTHAALRDGSVDATETAALQKVGNSLRDASGTADAFKARQPELEDKKSFGSDLKDRVYSWFAGAPETGKALLKHARELF
ncbi:MAG: peptidoglycan-binding domain-containing protein [Deltaproteobacteria bacterium]|nr:peptidoglycan-binding domain-containing protein [Deltaproteobacteria bacterium]